MSRVLLAVLACLVLAAPARGAVLGDWSGPPDAPAGVLLLHGGAWQARGQVELDRLTARVAGFAAQGARVLNADMAAGAVGLTDARDAYDALDAAVPGPICIYGESSGGHLALLLATERDVACVLARAAPTDLPALTADGGEFVGWMAQVAFGSDLAASSPLARAPRLRSTPLLLAGARDDTWVPFVQQRRLAAAVPGAEVVELAPGTGTFVHAQVDVDALDALQVREHALVARTTGLPTYVPPAVERPAAAPPVGAPPPAAATPAPAHGRAHAPGPLLRPRRLGSLAFTQVVREAGHLEWRLLRGTRVVARASRVLRRSGTVTVRLHATRSGRAALRGARTLVLESRLTTSANTRHVRRDHVP